MLKKPKNLSPRIKWLRDYYFKGNGRNWNNEFTSWSTGTDWDIQYNEMTYYIVPETFALLQPIRSSYRQSARPISLPADFWDRPLVMRRAWFVKEVIVKYVPAEILPGDLIAGSRFNVQTSFCLTKKEQKDFDKKLLGKNGARKAVKWFHDHGYGNSGATSGHLIPDYPSVLQKGWNGIKLELEDKFHLLSREEQTGKAGEQLQAMITASRMPVELAERYASICLKEAAEEKDSVRKAELETMASNLSKVPEKPAETFWEALQSLWITHMLVMTDENYPGPGVSFGRLDQYLLPYYEKSIREGMDRDLAGEILKCFWVHCNTAYDAMIRNGNNGITAGFGQLFTLSGMGKNGKDMTNDLTWLLLEVIDDMSPILEPKPNVRIHRNTPEPLLDKLIEMIAGSQGAPFLLNFDERSMAGMMKESAMAKVETLINLENVYEYAPVGCLENTMAGNDRSGTVDNNLNILKAVELAMNNGRDLIPFTDIMSGKTERIKQDGPATGAPENFKTWEDYFEAYKTQTSYIIEKCVNTYELSESVRAEYFRTPYLSSLIKGCADRGKDVTEGGSELSFTTVEAVTYATTVDSLLAIKYLVFDEKKCTMKELVQALKDNWESHEILQARAKNKAPKYGRDDDEADKLAEEVMRFWTEEVWKYKTRSTGRQFRPGMLSWNYWAGDGFIMAASADGRTKGQFLSNAICPSNGADINGPTANTNSVGKVLGGKSPDTLGTAGDWQEFNNILPNGASHTITFNPSILRDPDHKNKFKAFLKSYSENGGTALQINILDPEMLKDAQKNPEDYSNLLVRITGYNAYFTSIGRELQNEVIARISHEGI
ncbi:MAG: hypothetical protein JEY99_06810 [Spirochaetales bacterium]|nr:hypothetical protein [Spirochaetales bacterium]